MHGGLVSKVKERDWEKQEVDEASVKVCFLESSNERVKESECG
jgi:hypothetical protein